MTTLVSGVVGSTAYGLAREGSDVDRLGVFVAPTEEVAGLDWNSHRESRVTTGPDTTFHEVGKYLRLALKGNPTVNELLWLPPELVEVVDPGHGRRLLGLRHAVLSEPAVRSAYGGYARHLLRLLRQGRELLATGTLTLRVANPADYFAFDGMTTEQMLRVYEREDALFRATDSVLPAEPDRDAVRVYLADVRVAFLRAA